MTARCAFCVVLAFCSLTAAVGSAERSPAPEETLRSWAKAFVAGDLAALLAFYDDSKDVVAIQS